MPSYRTYRRSTLNTSQVANDISDTKSIASSVSIASQASQGSQDDMNSTKGLPYWTKSEMASREGLPQCWKWICNSQCKRRPFLTYLGEDKLPDGIDDTLVPQDQCCNGCNPDLSPVLTQPPEIPSASVRPRANTRASIALGLLEKWAIQRADEIYQSANRRFPMPPSAFIDEQSLWQLVVLFNNIPRADSDFWDNLTVDVLHQEVPLLQEWRF